MFDGVAFTVKPDTTKACPKCGNTWLVELEKFNQKWCMDNQNHDDNQNLKIDWFLNAGQKQRS